MLHTGLKQKCLHAVALCKKNDSYLYFVQQWSYNLQLYSAQMGSFSIIFSYNIIYKRLYN